MHGTWGIYPRRRCQESLGFGIGHDDDDDDEVGHDDDDDDELMTS